MFSTASRRCIQCTRNFKSPQLQTKPLQQIATITTSSAPPSTEPKPKTIEHGTSGKRRRALTEEQEHFLDSAVCLLRVALVPRN